MNERMSERAEMCIEIMKTLHQETKGAADLLHGVK